MHLILLSPHSASSKNCDTVGSSTFFKVAQLKRGNMVSIHIHLYLQQYRLFLFFPSSPATPNKNNKNQADKSATRRFFQDFLSKVISPL